jgi:hypothetical protein
LAVFAAAGCTTAQTSSRWHQAGAPDGPGASGATSPQPARLVAYRLPVLLPAPVSDAVVFVDGSSLLVAGGLTGQDTSTATVVRIDPASNQANDAGRLAAPVHDAAGLTLAGADLLFGGGTSASTATVQLVRPGQPGQVAGALPEPRSDLVAAATGGVGYLLGGYTGTRMLAGVLQTADGRSFRSVAVLPVPVRYPAVAASQGRLWLFGGITSAGTPTDVVQRVDPVAGTAQVVGHLPHALSHASGFVLGTGMYLAGGQIAGGGRTDAILRVDPNGTVIQAGALPKPLSDAGVAVIGDVAYLVGGQAPAAVADIVEIRAASG